MCADIARITLHECARLLGYKDVRSARRWCKMHSVAVIRDRGTKTPYVLKSEYEAIRLLSLETHLKTRYGTHWKQALQAYQTADIDNVKNMLKDTTKKTLHPKETAKISGTHAARFHAELMLAIATSQA